MKTEDDTLRLDFGLLVNVARIVRRVFVSGRRDFSVDPAGAAVEKRDPTFGKGRFGEKARSVDVDFPVGVVTQARFPVHRGDVEDAIDTTNRFAQTGAVRQVRFEAFDVDAVEEREIARFPYQSFDLVPGLTQQTR